MDIKNLKFKIKNYLLDILFPPYCINCGHENNSWLCFSCAKKIVPVVSQVCPVCEKLSPAGAYHLKCKKGKYLKGILSSAYFEEGPIREMIHNLKYNGLTSMVELLVDLMAKALTKNFQFQILNFQSNSNFIITYVPLHWLRQAGRGYNQSELLARAIGEKIGIDVCPLLSKTKSTKRQVKLRGNARRKNLQDVFSLKSDVSIKNKKIIIVDDITTTGSTLNECAAVLKKAGAKEIWGLVVSRG